jgi:hypothetical protein
MVNLGASNIRLMAWVTVVDGVDGYDIILWLTD